MFDDEDGFLTIEKYHTIRTNKEIADEWKNETKMRFDLQFDKKNSIYLQKSELWNAYVTIIVNCGIIGTYISRLFNQNWNEGSFL